LRFHPFVDLTKQHDQHGDKPLDLRGKPNFSTQTWGRKSIDDIIPEKTMLSGKVFLKTIDGQRCLSFAESLEVLAQECNRQRWGICLGKLG